MRPFTYVRPETLEDAVAELRGANGDPETGDESIDRELLPDVRLLGGGTNLVDLMKLGVERPARLVDVTGLPLANVTVDEDGVLTIGALARNSDVAVHPAVRREFSVISQALLSGASGQLRNIATCGGNLMQRTRCSYFMDATKPCNKRVPGSGCPALTGENHNLAILGTSEHCIATHPSDFAVALTATTARIGLVGPAGTRDVELDQLYLPVGNSPHRETVLGNDEIIASIVVPPLPSRARAAYRKVRERASYAFALVSVAAVVTVTDGRFDQVRIGLGGVASHPWRARAAEEVLQGRPVTRDLIEDAADAEMAPARPRPGNAYKVELAREVLVEVLTGLVEGRTEARP
jgi:xanthine dehydrogenase YagS FAD-binding subunit